MNTLLDILNTAWADTLWLWNNWGWLILPLFGAIFTFVTDRKKFVQQLTALFLEAERQFVLSGSGEAKMAWAIDQAYHFAPTRVQVAIGVLAAMNGGKTAEEFLNGIAQKLFSAIEQKYNDAPLPPLANVPTFGDTPTMVTGLASDTTPASVFLTGQIPPHG